MATSPKNILGNTIKLDYPIGSHQLSKSPIMNRRLESQVGKVSLDLANLSNKSALQKLIALKNQKNPVFLPNNLNKKDNQTNLKYQTRTLPIGRYLRTSEGEKVKPVIQLQSAFDEEDQENDQNNKRPIVQVPKTPGKFYSPFSQNNIFLNFSKNQNSNILNKNSKDENKQISPKYPKLRNANSMVREAIKSSPIYYVKESNTVMEYSYKEDQNKSHKEEMEDKGKSIDNFNGNKFNTLFELFDGHGSDYVSKYLQSKYHLKYSEKLLEYGNDYERALKDSFIELDEEIVDMKMPEAGSTACIVHVVRKSPSNLIVYCANVGDTRCSLISPVSFKRLTYDHRATDKKEKERILKEGGNVIDDRVEGQLMLTKAFGDYELKDRGVSAEPYISKIEIDLNEKNQFLIIACDGIWDILSEQEIQNIIMFNNNTAELPNTIIKNVLLKDAWDNLSVFVVKLT